MSLIYSCPCMSKEDFEAYKKRFEDVKFSEPKTWKHLGEKGWWTYPAIIFTIVNVNDNVKVIDCHHAILPKESLLKVLGLSQEELKFEFDTKNSPDPTMPEQLDTREV